jgi:hypothetical protein
MRYHVDILVRDRRMGVPPMWACRVRARGLVAKGELKYMCCIAGIYSTTKFKKHLSVLCLTYREPLPEGTRC